ncbi:MAG: DUF882 domain-containing protein [Polyangiaceae bacterium]
MTAFGAGALGVGDARAETAHVVGKGQTLFWIAKRYRTTPEAIREANGLRPGQLIHPGLSLTIPGTSRSEAKDAKGKTAKDRDAKDAKKGTKDAKKGKSARDDDEDDDDARKGKGARGSKGAKSAKEKDSKDAKAKGKDAGKVAKGGKAGKDAKEAKDGKGSKDAKAKDAKKGKGSAKESGGSYAARPKKPGFVKMVRGTETLSAQVLARGKVNQASLPGLTRILRHVASDSKKPVDPRLAYLIGVVSDHFGGRTIHVVSGYRPFSKKQYTPHSNHNLGKAMDFSVDGVPNTVVRDFCRTLRDAGVGYYPNSTFVHLDVRSGKAYWIDYSGPGEAPRYHKSSKGRVDESARDVEAADESGSSGTQSEAKQATEKKDGKSEVKDPKPPVSKEPGAQAPTPPKPDSPTKDKGKSDDPYL